MRRILALFLVVFALVPTHHAAAAGQLQLVIEPRDSVSPLVSFINAAQHTLDGEVYLATSQPVLRALEAAAARHVTVRINLDPHPFGTSPTVVKRAYNQLASHGVQVRWTSSAFVYTHAKYAVSDMIRAWIGTMNWDNAGTQSNREFAIIDTDPAVVSQAEAVFAADWTHTPYRGPDGALVLSPNNARAQIEGLITHARHWIDVEAEEMGDQAVTSDLEAAVHRGVQVRLVTTLDDNIGSLAGVIPVVKRLSRPYVHAKAILCDGVAMYTGSENFSAGSLDSNREMGLIVTDRSIIEQVEATFAGDVGGPVRTASFTGQAGATPTSLGATKPTTSTSGGALSVVVQVSPNPIPYGGYPTVTVRTAPAAVCAISVRYASGKGPTSYSDHSATATASGTIMEQGKWRMESKSAGGTVTASCTSKGATATGTFSFQIG